MVPGSFRVEKDSLGELQVPTDALYGAQTQRAVENFPISGLHPWRAFIWSMATIKRAAAEVNFDLGLLDEERANAIIKAAQEVIDGKWDWAGWGDNDLPGKTNGHYSVLIKP